MIEKIKIALITCALFLFSLVILSAQVYPELGDVNGDERIDIIDALQTAQYYVNLKPSPFNPDNADVNCDNSIDIIDALLIAQHYVELIDSFSSCGTPGPTPVSTPIVTDPTSHAIIADHTIINKVRLDQIPESAIEAAKSLLHIAYDHTSHGSQLTSGMEKLIPFKENNGGTIGLYAFAPGGANGVLDFTDYFTSVPDLGYYPEWLYATREYLGWDCEIPDDYSIGSANYNSNCNVVIWSWCYLKAGESSILEYLSAMDSLREDYPEVQFVYMTGHSNGTGENGPVHYWNKYIRQYCIDHDLILYDFYDIELYDPDGNYFGDKRVTDGCYYDNEIPYDSGTQDGNWALEWQSTHELNRDWYECGAAHSQALNANMKAYAAWWLFARLAGWDGI